MDPEGEKTESPFLKGHDARRFPEQVIPKKSGVEPGFDPPYLRKKHCVYAASLPMSGAGGL